MLRFARTSCVEPASSVAPAVLLVVAAVVPLATAAPAATTRKPVSAQLSSLAKSRVRRLISTSCGVNAMWGVARHL